MFKLAVLFALVAAAFAAPQYLLNGGFAGPLASPYLSGLTGISAYSSLAAPLAYSAPAPYAYNTAPLVSYAAEPVEQHGYTIAY